MVIFEILSMSYYNIPGMLYLLSSINIQSKSILEGSVLYMSGVTKSWGKQSIKIVIAPEDCWDGLKRVMDGETQNNVNVISSLISDSVVLFLLLDISGWHVQSYI